MISRSLTVSLICATILIAADAPKSPRSLEAIVEDEGVFAFSDGSSYYVFEKDGTFHLQPVGLSGRTISGRWKRFDSPILEITGVWSWVNGIYERDDRRRMKVYVAPRGESQPTDFYAGHTRVRRIYPVYFFIDEIGKDKKA